jgi:putative flavoprotein involved in K+ transport
MTNMDHGKTIVIGSGQAGLAMGYQLAQLGQQFTILDAAERIGVSWRNRWDSLVLFTPAGYSNLPGLPFPADSGHFPTRLEMADYLERYAETFALPVELGVRVEEVSAVDGGFRVETSRGPHRASNVVVATGAFPEPRIPSSAGELDESIHQVHSSAYRNPDQLPPGDVLVVGAASSGTQIALDLAPTRRVWLAGRSAPFVPHRVLGVSIFGLLTRTLFRVPVTTALGRKVAHKLISGGAPIVGHEPSIVERSGIERVPRFAGAEAGLPRLEDGEIVEPQVIVWATGFDYNYGWIKLPGFDEKGMPRQVRGVIEEAPGLYFIGLPFMYRGLSGIIQGVGDDAAYLAQQIRERTSDQRHRVTAEETLLVASDAGPRGWA